MTPSDHRVVNATYGDLKNV